MHASESDITVFVTLKDGIVFYCTLQCLYIMECQTQGMQDGQTHARMCNFCLNCFKMDSGQQVVQNNDMLPAVS